jgi:2-polyprenyl-3-methyl-5-hydroxy-6-metoxy-1,4-benzoquinol methylase
MTKTRCPLCHGAAFSQERLGLLKCARCGLTLSPAIWQPHANELLEAEWFGENYQPETSCWVRWFEILNNRRTMGLLTRARPCGRRLLEVGVGSGSLLLAAREQGFEVMGCDLSRAICTRAERLGIRVHCGRLEELQGEGQFDMVLINHVLEHVHDPVALLRDARRLLAPGGLVHICVPNVSCSEARLRGWTSYEPYHLTYFTPATLKHAITSSGLLLERLFTHESFSGWFLTVLRSGIGVNRNGRIQPNVWTKRASTGCARSVLVEHTYRLAMVCAGGILWPLRLWQASIGRGDEIVCLARKSAPDRGSEVYAS